MGKNRFHAAKPPAGRNSQLSLAEAPAGKRPRDREQQQRQEQQLGQQQGQQEQQPEQSEQPLQQASAAPPPKKARHAFSIRSVQRWQKLHKGDLQLVKKSSGTVLAVFEGAPLPDSSDLAMRCRICHKYQARLRRMSCKDNTWAEGTCQNWRRCTGGVARAC